MRAQRWKRLSDQTVHAVSPQLTPKIDLRVLANSALKAIRTPSPSQATLAGSMEVISGSSVADHHAPRIPRGPSLRRVSSRTAMKRSCSAPVLAPVWEPDCEELEDVPSFLHSDGVRRRLTCEGSAPAPSRSAPSTLHGPWSKVLLAVR